MKTHLVYGVKNSNIEYVRNQVEKALGVQFELHESLYYGGDYYRYQGAYPEKIVIRKNLDLIDNEPAELDFRDYEVLLYIENAGDSVKLNLAQIEEIPNVKLLKSK